MRILVTGASGFIGRNLVARLAALGNHEVERFDVHNSPTDLTDYLRAADIVYHLAGVNRPQKSSEFETGNAGLSRTICETLTSLDKAPKIVMSSSVQAALDNDYGRSKLRAEQALRDYARISGAAVRIYRLTNVFGKWCRPNYNSVVATFCHNTANGLPIQISDPTRELDLAYIDDVVEAFLSELEDGDEQCPIPSYHLDLGDLAGRIQAFHEMRTSLLTPDLSVRFNQQLYATYLSYVPDEDRRGQLQIRSDDRGALAEFIKSRHFGQIFVSRTRPGITRGNHYHHTKTEKFFVVEGEALVRMRHIESSEVVEYRVNGEAFQVIDIPPGYAHSIENIGTGELVTLFWASEIFDPDRPDTYFEPVIPVPAHSAEVLA